MPNLHSLYRSLMKVRDDIFLHVFSILNEKVSHMCVEFLLGNDLSTFGKQSIIRIAELYNFHIPGDNLFDDDMGLCIAAIVLNETTKEIMSDVLAHDGGPIMEDERFLEMLDLIEKFDDWFVEESVFSEEEGE